MQRRGTFLSKLAYQKVRIRRRASSYNTLMSTPPPPPLAVFDFTRYFGATNLTQNYSRRKHWPALAKSNLASSKVESFTFVSFRWPWISFPHSPITAHWTFAGLETLGPHAPPKEFRITTGSHWLFTLTIHLHEWKYKTPSETTSEDPLRLHCIMFSRSRWKMKLSYTEPRWRAIASWRNARAKVRWQF